MRVKIILTSLVMVFSVFLFDADPAQAGYSCNGHDHYHEGGWIKHDRRGLVSYDGTDNNLHRKWLRKVYNRNTGYYQATYAIFVPCGPIASQPLEPTDIIGTEVVAV
jgi:hypothetical protein